MPQFPGFCGDSYQSQSRLVSVARTVNFYPEVIQTESPKNKIVLYPTPGVRVVASAGLPNKGRGVFAQTNRAFAVFGDKLKEVTPGPLSPAGEWTATLTDKGTVLVDEFPVTMTVNGTGGNQLAVTSGGQLYILDLGDDTFTAVTIEHEMGIAKPLMVVFLNGLFITLDAVASIINVSARLDGLSWDPTDMAPRDDASDPWRSLAISSSKELWLLGERTGSIYFDAGTAPFTLQPREGLLITPGIAAPFSLQEVNGSMMWVASSRDGTGTVVRARGYNTEVVSTEAVDYAIRTYARDGMLKDAVAYTYEEQGHHFYVLNFPTADHTWAFDDKTNWWHERGSYNGGTGLFDAWSPQYHMHEFGRHLLSDHRRGLLYESSIDEFTDVAGTPLRRLRVAPGLVNEQKRIYYDRLRVYLERGVALRNGQGNDPLVYLRTSNDGGKTWNSERAKHAGKMGEFRPSYLQWDQLGSATDRVFAFYVSDPIPWRIVDAYLTVRMGA